MQMDVIYALILTASELMKLPISLVLQSQTNKSLNSKADVFVYDFYIVSVLLYFCFGNTNLLYSKQDISAYPFIEHLTQKGNGSQKNVYVEFGAMF